MLKVFHNIQHRLTFKWPKVPKIGTFGQNYDFKIRRDNWKNSYERRAYESVEGKSLSLDISQNQRKTQLGQERVNASSIKPKFEYNAISIHYLIPVI